MDVVILKGIARFLRRVMRCFMAAAVDPEQVVDEWAKTLWDELDYKHEGRAMEHMRDALCGTVGGLVIPRVHWELTALRVLASEWVDGFKITEDPRRVTQRHISIGVEAVAAMILEAGACEVGRCEVLAIGDYDHGSELEDVHADADDATDGDNTVIGVTVAAVVWMVMAVVGDSIGAVQQRKGELYLRLSCSYGHPKVGVVHADPHPGNIILTQEDDICLLDFGMVCLVPEHHRTVWAKCVVDLVRRDHGAVLDDLIEIGFFPRECPREEMLPVLSKIWDQLVECGSDITKRKSAVQLLYSEILTLVRRFEFALPDYYVALVRALLTLEGMALAADCNFDIFEALLRDGRREDGASEDFGIWLDAVLCVSGAVRLLVITEWEESPHLFMNSSEVLPFLAVSEDPSQILQLPGLVDFSFSSIGRKAQTINGKVENPDALESGASEAEVGRQQKDRRLMLYRVPVASNMTPETLSLYKAGMAVDVDVGDTFLQRLSMPAKGDSKWTIVEIYDYTCPHCWYAVPIYMHVAEAYADNPRIQFTSINCHLSYNMEVCFLLENIGRVKDFPTFLACPPHETVDADVQLRHSHPAQVMAKRLPPHHPTRLALLKLAHCRHKFVEEDAKSGLEDPYLSATQLADWVRVTTGEKALLPADLNIGANFHRKMPVSAIAPPGRPGWLRDDEEGRPGVSRYFPGERWYDALMGFVAFVYQGYQPSKLQPTLEVTRYLSMETVRGSWKIVYTRRQDPNGFHYTTQVLHVPTNKVVKKLEGSDLVTKFGEHESGENLPEFVATTKDGVEILQLKVNDIKTGEKRIYPLKAFPVKGKELAKLADSLERRGSDILPSEARQVIANWSIDVGLGDPEYEAGDEVAKQEHVNGLVKRTSRSSGRHGTLQSLTCPQSSTCNLWNLLHVTMAAVAARGFSGRTLLGDGSILSHGSEGGMALRYQDPEIGVREAQAFVRTFVDNFLNCKQCRERFIWDYDQCNYGRCDYKDWQSLPLWLWRVHNAVSLHVASHRDTPVDRRWPEYQDCPRCWREDLVLGKPVRLLSEHPEPDAYDLQARSESRWSSQELDMPFNLKDKRQAREKKWRVSENALCVTALVGGWPAGYFAMQTFRHKSAKKSFQDKYATATSCNLLLCGLHPRIRSRLRTAFQRWLRTR
ncbi:ABC1K3 [Symbiodinium sp. KB8]|nr:ABC1K3 [Symbiodinium sp. KB8]